MAGSWAQTLGAIGDRPEDSDEVRLQHRFLIATGVAMSCGGLLWGSLCVGFGMAEPAVIPYGYAGVTAINFGFLWATKRFAVARTVQILISLLLPFLFQWWLGGFHSSGAVMIWAMLAFVASLSFDNPRTSIFWIFLYLVLTVTSGLIEPQLETPVQIRGEGTSTLLMTINLSVVSTMVFALTLAFWRLRLGAAEELAEKNLLLEEKNQAIVASQHALIQSEKLAALGQLIAGVAHELNTPLGAIRASAGNLQVALEETLVELPAVLRSATEEELDDMRALLESARGSNSTLTSKEERKLRRALNAELIEGGVEGSAHIADRLVQIGITRIDDPGTRGLVSSPRAAALVRGAYNIAGLQRNRATIDLASERASKIVFALKSYAHPGADGETTDASLEENLETVLTLYHNKLKHGVDLVRDFTEGVRIAAHHDELNQVWTNLVHNALQAMNNQGRLEVSVQQEGEDAIVRVTDDGPGIPDDKLSRIFEPFFTTKASGEGSGLGLSISRDIVERHGGVIAVDSRPGRTEFSVRLPMER